MPENWVVTPEELVGCQNQAIGLAESLGLAHVLKEVKPPTNLWQQLFPRDHGLQPPWLEMLISCVRRSVPISLAIRKASQGWTFTVHIQDPHTNPVNFDAVIVPAHDRLRGLNVFVTRGALHRVPAENSAPQPRNFVRCWPRFRIR